MPRAAITNKEGNGKIRGKYALFEPSEVKRIQDLVEKILGPRTGEVIEVGALTTDDIESWFDIRRKLRQIAAAAGKTTSAAAQ